jgi:hypothetical protein
MGVTHGHLKTLMHGSERYHEIRWNVVYSAKFGFLPWHVVRRMPPYVHAW